VVGGDPDKDVAVLQLLDISPEKMRELKPVQLGISSTLMVGQRCAAVRNVYMFSSLATVMSAGWSSSAWHPPVTA
jgi:S1-C subfamily serine protease